MSNEEKTNPLPSPKEFFLKIPLYKWFPFPDASAWKGVEALQEYDKTIDLHCEKCDSDSVFQSKASDSYSFRETVADHLFTVPFDCVRCQTKVHFVFEVRNESVAKIGQYPSMADLEATRLNKYRKVLVPERYADGQGCRFGGPWGGDWRICLLAAGLRTSY